MALTAAAVRNAKPREKPYKLTDGRGLYLLVQPSGGRLWRLDYRHNGKRRTRALGSFPGVQLVDAREAVEDARKKLRDDQDPAQLRRQEKRRKREARNHTFKAVSLRWFESRKGGWVQGYSKRVWSRLESDIFPQFGAREVADIEAADVLAALRLIEARGAIEMAKRVGHYCRDIFRFARAEGLTRTDPTADIRGALKAVEVKKRRTALKAVELPEFLRRLDEFEGGLRTQLAIRLALLTFVSSSQSA